MVTRVPYTGGASSGVPCLRKGMTNKAHYLTKRGMLASVNHVIILGALQTSKVRGLGSVNV